MLPRIADGVFGEGIRMHGGGCRSSYRNSLQVPEQQTEGEPCVLPRRLVAIQRLVATAQRSTLVSLRGDSGVLPTLGPNIQQHPRLSRRYIRLDRRRDSGISPQVNKVQGNGPLGMPSMPVTRSIEVRVLSSIMMMYGQSDSVHSRIVLCRARRGDIRIDRLVRVDC